MYAGLGLAVVAMIVPYVDHATANMLAGHIRDGAKYYGREHPAALVSFIALINAPNRLCVITRRPGGDDQPGQFG